MLENSGLELIKKDDFNPVRKPAHWFADASEDEKNEMIKKNGAYGRIICRCEGVSEGEIREAVRTNPPTRDLDGIKRRTRAQMGRCQGGFCTPYLAEILAEELHIDITEITKSGTGSKIIVGKTKGVRGL